MSIIGKIGNLIFDPIVYVLGGRTSKQLAEDRAKARANRMNLPRRTYHDDGHGGVYSKIVDEDAVRSEKPVDER